MQNEGESGRKQINNYTRILTIAICAVQAPSYISLYASGIQGALPQDPGSLWWATAVISMVAGSMFSVWLGERITDKGIGNGISLLIMVGNIYGSFVDANNIFILNLNNDKINITKILLI